MEESSLFLVFFFILLPLDNAYTSMHGLVQVRDRAWFVRLYGEITSSFSSGIVDRTGAQTMLYLTCTMISSVDLAYYGVSRAKYWVSVNSGAM